MQARYWALAFVAAITLEFLDCAKITAQEDNKEAPKEAAKRLRVLLMSSGPGREYQWLRDILLREVREKRAELCIYLQSAQGTETDQKAEIDQKVPDERLLKRFPGGFEPVAGKGGRFDSLAEFDVIVAIDADWTQLHTGQLAHLRAWVHYQGGGLIFVAGPVHTFQVASAGHDLRNLRALLPVELWDIRLAAGDRALPRLDPWRSYPLSFPKESGEHLCLKLPGHAGLAGWDKFFWGDQKPKLKAPVRGFHSYYPVKRVKAGAQVLATFAAQPVSGNNPEGDAQPYLAAMSQGSGRVIYIGSGETWRLRTYRADCHEHFWGELARFAGANRRLEPASRNLLIADQEAAVGDYVAVQGRLVGREGKPLPRNVRASVKITPPAGARFAVDSMDLQPVLVDQLPTGWFQGRYKVLHEGDYEMSLAVPGDEAPLSARLRVTRPAQAGSEAPSIAQGDLSSRFAQWSTRMERLARVSTASANPEIRAIATQVSSALDAAWKDNVAGELVKLKDDVKPGAGKLAILKSRVGISRGLDSALAKLDRELNQRKDDGPKVEDLIAEGAPWCRQLDHLAWRLDVLVQQLERDRELLAAAVRLVELKEAEASVAERLRELAAELVKTQRNAAGLGEEIKAQQEKARGNKSLVREQSLLDTYFDKAFNPLSGEIAQALKTSSALIDLAGAGKLDADQVRQLQKRLDALGTSLRDHDEDLRFLRVFAFHARLELAQMRQAQLQQTQSLLLLQKKAEADLLNDLLK